MAIIEDQLIEYTCKGQKNLGGNLNGYAVSIHSRTGKTGEMTFATSCTNGFSALRDMLMMHKFETFKVATAMLRTGYINIMIKFPVAPTRTDWEGAANAIIPLLREYWYLPEEHCFICHGKKCDCMGHYADTYRPLHRECFEKRVSRAVARVNGKNNGSSALLGAIGGGALLVILNVVIFLVTHGRFELMYGFLCFLCYKGYTLAGGQSGKKASIAVISLSLIFTLVSEIAIKVLIAGQTFAEYFSSPFELLFSLAFCGIGIAAISKSLFTSAEKLAALERDALGSVIDKEVKQDFQQDEADEMVEKLEQAAHEMDEAEKANEPAEQQEQ